MKSLREQLSEIARRRYDIERRRMIGLHGEERGQKKVDIMAARWVLQEKKLAPLNKAANESFWRSLLTEITCA